MFIIILLGISNEGWFDPYLLLNAFKRKILSLGVHMIYGEVKGLNIKDEQINSVQVSVHTVFFHSLILILFFIPILSYVHSSMTWTTFYLSLFVRSFEIDIQLKLVNVIRPIKLINAGNSSHLMIKKYTMLLLYYSL